MSPSNSDIIGTPITTPVNNLKPSKLFGDDDSEFKPTKLFDDSVTPKKNPRLVDEFAHISESETESKTKSNNKSRFIPKIIERK